MTVQHQLQACTRRGKGPQFLPMARHGKSEYIMASCYAGLLRHVSRRHPQVIFSADLCVRLRMATFDPPEREGCPFPGACIMGVLFIARTREIHM